MNATCPACGGPGTLGVVAYYSEETVCAAYRCCGTWGVVFEALSDYVCACGEEVTVNEFTGPLDATVTDERLALRLPCPCGGSVKDDFRRVGVVELRE